MKTMNEFLKEAEECIKENDVSTNTVGSVAGVQGNQAGVQGKPDTLVGTSMGGDWKRYIKTILARTARVIRRRRTKG